MKYLLYIFVAFVGVWFGGALARRRRGGASKVELKQMRKSAHKSVEGKIKNRKQAILQYTRQRGTVTNDEVEGMFCVSDGTARKYLNDLEKEGKLKQIGQTGRGVHYVAQ